MMFRIHTPIPTWFEAEWRSRDFDISIWLSEGDVVFKLYTIDFDGDYPSNADVYLTQYGPCVISKMVIASYADQIEVP